MKNNSIGALVTKHREAANLSRNGLAVKAGLDPSYLMRLERGDVTNPSFLSISQIADALGVALDLFKKKEKK